MTLIQDEAEQNLQDDLDIDHGYPETAAAAIRRQVALGIREGFHAEVQQQQAEATAAHTLYQFFKIHPELNCLANEGILRHWCREQSILVSGDAINLAYEACRHMLAVKPPDKPTPPLTPAEQVRKENKRLLGMSKKDLWAEVKRTHAAQIPTIKIPYSAKQLKAMQPRVLRDLISFPNGQDRENGAVRAAVNRILAEDAARTRR
jgi:hypothetical protein